jgi:molybdopterin/thiamine biosynthesis adenylyltransferase
MTTTLVIPEGLADRIQELAGSYVETGGVLLARPVEALNGDLRLLARELLEVPDDAYERRESQQLVIRSDGYVAALGRAEVTGCLPLWFHTHPGAEGTPEQSRHDRRVDEQLSDLFRLRADSKYYGAVVASYNRADGLTFTGHLDDGAAITPIDRLFTVGPRLALTQNFESDGAAVPALFDRNIRAFGGDVQRVLGDLRIAVVGCGGTGSAVAEQLVRLGVRRLVLIDPDELSVSNLTRVYGSYTTDVGARKVDVLAEHLTLIAADVQIERLASKITVLPTARSLIQADVIFGCTDDNAGRLVLSRYATFMLTPVIDCGVLLSSDSNHRLDGIHGRVTVLHPGAACLTCRNRVDLALASSEMLTPEERVRRVDEGYAPALAGIEPAVVTFTSMVGAMAVSELLERLTHYGDTPVPSEILLRLHDREISTNIQPPKARHYCDPASGKLGLGDVQPFLEQAW